ncbi:hypothetical protein BDR26DRAFT_864288 [Obelidium mucronatum]|nr:hypothetical protein BDR26DRAFT_864288 [Obelidium mucronatum]
MKLAKKESESGIMHLLGKYPDNRIALRGCINVALSRDLRKMAWLACLSDNDTAKDFFNYINTKRIQKNTAIYGTTLFHICQSFLGTFPMLYQLASQYRVIKRMEQSLGYLISQNSIPHLRSLDLAIEALPEDELTQRNNPTRAHPELAQFQLLNEEGNLRRRQMMLMVPFLKAIELDDVDVSHSNALGKRKTKYHDEDGEFNRVVVARAAEGDSSSKDWLNVFYANEDGSRRKKHGYSLDWDESRTARITEVFSRFWSIIPFNWREEGDLMVETIAADVETYLHKEDPDLYTFLAKLLGKGAIGHDFSGFRKYIRHMIGDVFVGKCNLSVLCYIFDQLVIASFEATGDEKFPSMDTLCAWICGSMIIQMKDKIMNCTSVEDLYPVSAIHQSAMTVSILSTTMEVHFLSKFRASLADTYPVPSPFIDLPNHVFGYNATAPSLWPVEKKNSELYEKMVLYLTNCRRIEEGKKKLGSRQDNTSPLSEQDLVFAESEEYVLLKEFYIEKRRKERRLKELMRKWRSFSKSLALWAVYVKRVKKKVAIRAQKSLEKDRIERERLRQLQLEEEYRRKQAEQDEMGSSFLHRLINKDEDDGPYGVWGDDNGLLNDDDDLHMHSTDSFGLGNDPLFAEELRRQEALKAAEAAAAAEAERRRQLARNASQVPKPGIVKNTLVVRVASYIGEEQINLTALGQIIDAIFKKVQYILQGSFTMNMTMVNLVTHALSFESRLEKDLVSVLKKGFPKGGFYTTLSSLPEKQRIKVLDSIERMRMKRLEASLASSGQSKADESQLMAAEEDRSVDGSVRDVAIDVIAGKLYNRKIKDMKRFPGIFSSIVEGLKTVIDGDKDVREANWLASLSRENEFHRAERAAWKSIFGDSPEYTEARVKNLVQGAAASDKRDSFMREVERFLK